MKVKRVKKFHIPVLLSVPAVSWATLRVSFFLRAKNIFVEQWKCGFVCNSP